MINYTITLSLLICAVILLRAVFRKRVPQRLIYAMWLAVLIKMCLPFSFIALDIPALPGVCPNSVGSITAETTTVFETEIKDTSAVTNPPITHPSQITEKPIVTTPPATVPNVTAEPVVTAPAITAPPVVTAPPAVTVPAVSDEIKNPTSASPAETVITQSPPATAKPKQNVFDLGKTLLVLSLLGSVAVGAFFGLSAIQFSAKLREDRFFLKKAGRVGVYVSQNALTPCVFGIVPKIYVTPAAAESENLDLILRHELTHVRHGDNLWAVVRTAALVIFWWNPLVWAAAMLSRRDTELACDEAVSAHLDRDGRSAYAHTIIDSIPQKHSHAPGLSGAPLKERLIMITKKSKTSAVCVTLALVLTLTAAGCSFIGSKDQTPDDTTKSSDTTEPNDTTESSDNVDPEKESYFGTIIPNPIEFTFGEGVVEVSAFEGYGRIKTIEIDSEHILTSSYSYDSDTYTHINITVYIVNIANGKIVHTEKLKDGAVPASVVKTIENGVIVNSFGYPDNGYTSWEVKRNGDSFTITEVPYNEDYYIELGIPDVLTSPDGKTKVYNIGPKDYITVKDESGAEKTLLEPYLTESNMTAPVKGYAAVEFIDNDSFVYKIISGDQIYGYGVYNLKTGEKVEYENEFVPCAAYNGKVYSTLSKNYEFGNKIAILGEDGVHREISVPEKYAPIFENMKDSNNPKRFPVFCEGKWFVFNVPNERVYVFSDDLSSLSAEIKLPWDRKFCDAYFSGNRMTVFFDEQIGSALPPDDTAKAPNGTDDPEPDKTPFVNSIIPQSEVSFVFGEDVINLSTFETSRDSETDKAVVAHPIYDPINEEYGEYYLLWAYRIEYENEVNYLKDSKIYLYNSRLGEIEASADMRDGVYISYVSKREDGNIIIIGYDKLADEDVSFVLERDSTLEAIDYLHIEYPRDAVIFEKTFVSPDGKTKVQNIYKEAIKITYPSGEEKTVLPRVDTDPYGMFATVYYACGFIDNERFIYSKIHGRLGIYNVNTHESVEYENSGGQEIVAFGENGIYTWNYNESGFQGTVGLLDRDEVFHRYGIPEVYSEVFDSGDIHFCSGKWVVVTGDELYVFSHDLKTILAIADLPKNRALHDIIINGNRISLFFTEEKDIESKKLESGIMRNDGGYSLSSQTYTELLGNTRGDVPIISFMRDKNNMLIRIYENQSGTPSYECSLVKITEDNLYSLPTRVSYTDDGFILYNYYYEDNEGVCDTAFRFTKGERGWSHEPTEFNIDGKVYACTEIARSPDGKYRAYREGRVHLVGDINYSSRILVSYNGGEKEIVSTLLPSNNDKEFCEIVGFIDNENLVYNITKGVAYYGYGIYNTKTEQKTEIRESRLRAVSVYEGKIYLYNSTNYSFYITDLTSSPIQLAPAVKTYYGTVDFVDGRWILYSKQGYVYAYNGDMTETLLVYNLYGYTDQGFLLVGKDKATVFECNQPPIEDIF